MKQRSSIFSKSIATRLMLVNTLICAVFILIAVVTFLSFQHIEDVLTQNVTKEIDGAIENAQAGRDLGRIVSGTTLLESTFFGKDDLLEAQGKRLIKKITNLEARTADPRLKESMVGYRRKLQRVLEQCTTVNALYHEIQSIQSQLTTSLTALEEIIANKMIEQVLQGEDISIIEQLAVIVAGYRETLLQINIRFAELGLAYFESPMTKQENPMFPVMDYLFLRLRPLSATEPEIAEYGLLIMAGVMKYREAVSGFHQVAGELRERLDEVYLEKEGILFLMGEMDKRFATTTEHMSENITAIISKSGKFLIILSGSVIILLGILPFFFVVSNIRKPMAAILTGIEAIGSGDLNTKIRLGRRDEWNIIEKALNNMASERKRAEEALRENEEKFRALAENQHDVVWTVNEDLEVDYVSPSCFKMTGTTAEETMGANPKDFYTDESYQKILMKLAEERQKAPNDMHAVVLEVEQYHENGHLFPVEITCMPIIIDNKFVGVQGISRDITERKKAEKEIRRLSIAVEQSPAVIAITDLNGNLEYVNPKFTELTGYTSEEAVRKNPKILKSGDQPDEIYKELWATITSGKIWRGEFHNRKKNGELFWEAASISPILDKQGNITHYVKVAEDISERKRAEEEKKKLEIKLQHAQKMEAIGTLAGGVAHDLNNILGGLVSYPELLLMQMPEDSPLRKPILTIQKSGEKAAAVVQDLLTLARRGVVVTEAVNLNHVITQYLESPEHENLQSYHPGVHMETHLEKDILNILGSSVHLSKTVMNLVSNAAEAMPEGGALTVSTENRYIDKPIIGYDDVEEGDYVVLTVSDTGTGISPEDMEKIFEPFYTKKKMGRSGTGLGMAVVWGTVKDHNGYIHVQSTEGKGTSFTLYFPVTRKSLEERSEISLKEYMGKGETILIVDDVEEQRKIASGMLKELGYSVASVASGEEAVEYLKTNKVDLLVLDMIMDPGMDGLDTYKKIIEIHPGQKAVIASGFSETDRAKELQGLGAGAYIRKPFLLEKIGLAVKEELER